MTEQILIRLKEVIRRTNLSRAHTYLLVAQRKFPAPVKLSTRASAWVLSEIDEWIAARIAASRSATPPAVGSEALDIDPEQLAHTSEPIEANQRIRRKKSVRRHTPRAHDLPVQ